MTYSDVLHRMKVTDEILDPVRVFVSDKEFGKIFIKAVCGDQYIIPTHRVLTSVAEVDACEFPNQCAIKPTHGCHEVILRKDGEPLDLDKIRGWFDYNFYHESREANYRALTPKVIIEQLVFPATDSCEYTILCYRGIAKVVVGISDRGTGLAATRFYDFDWNYLGIYRLADKGSDDVPPPSDLEAMREVAERIARYFPFVRVDFYSDGNTFYIGEITNNSGSGLLTYQPEGAEQKLSRLVFED